MGTKRLIKEGPRENRRIGLRNNICRFFKKKFCQIREQGNGAVAGRDKRSRKIFVSLYFALFFRLREITMQLYTKRSDSIEMGKLMMEKLTIALPLSTEGR